MIKNYKIDLSKNENKAKSELYNLGKHFIFIVGNNYRNKQLKARLRLPFVLLILFIGSALFTSLYFNDLMVSILAYSFCFLFSLTFFIKWVQVKTVIKNNNKKYKNTKIILQLPKDTMWDLALTNMYKGSVINNYLNVYYEEGFIFKKEKNQVRLLTSEFLITIKTNKVIFSYNKQLLDLITYQIKTVSEKKAKKFKYKSFDYQTWQRQKIKLYTCEILNLVDSKIELENKKLYNHFVQKWNNNKNNLEVYLKPEQQRLNKVDFTNLVSIEAYLKEKNITYNNYGNMIEFNLNGYHYKIDNKGKIVNEKVNLKSLLEATFND